MVCIKYLFLPVFVGFSLREVKGFDVREPQAAYYVFPKVEAVSEDSMKLSNYLLEEAKVAVTPGVAFGERGEGHLRFSYATSMELHKGGYGQA